MITILLDAASGTALPALFSHLPRSSSQSHSLHLVQRSRRRQRTSQLAYPVLLEAVPRR
jgi:hypothetical protein